MIECVSLTEGREKDFGHILGDAYFAGPAMYGGYAQFLLNTLKVSLSL